MAGLLNTLGAAGRVFGAGVDTYGAMETARLRQQQAAMAAMELKNQQDLRRASFGGLLPADGGDSTASTLAALAGGDPTQQPGPSQPPMSGQPPMPPQAQNMPPQMPGGPMPGNPMMLEPPPSGMPPQVSPSAPQGAPQMPPQARPMPPAGGGAPNMPGPGAPPPQMPGMGSQMSLGQMFQRLRTDPKNQGIPDATLLQMAMKVQQSLNGPDRMLLQYMMHNQMTPYQQAQLGISKERLEGMREDKQATLDLRKLILAQTGDLAQAKAWQVLNDPQNSNHPFRYNAQSGVSTELDGKTPYEPKGAAKMGAAKEPGAELAPETAKLIAERAKAGDTTAFSGLGFGNTGAKNRALVYKELQNMGVSGTDLAKATIAFRGQAQAVKSVETQGAKIDVAANEMKEFGPKVLAASQKVDRTEYPALNSLMQSWSKGTGGQDVIELGDWVNAMQNAYAQVVTRGGQSTEGARHKAEEVLNKAWSEGQLQRGVDVLMQEANAAMRATGRASSNVIDRVGSEPGAPHSPSDTPAAPTVSNW